MWNVSSICMHPMMNVVINSCSLWNVSSICIQCIPWWLYELTLAHCSLFTVHFQERGVPRTPRHAPYMPLIFHQRGYVKRFVNLYTVHPMMNVWINSSSLFTVHCSLLRERGVPHTQACPSFASKERCGTFRQSAYSASHDERIN